METHAHPPPPLLLLLLLSTAISLSLGLSCPNHCHCLPEMQHSQQFKISCQWTRLDQHSFVHFPVNATRSLVVRCRGDSQLSSSLSSGAFSRFYHLRHLRIEDCLLEDLPAGIFSGLPRLRTVHMEHVGEEFKGLRLSTGVFGGLERIEKLSLVRSGIRSIPQGSLCHFHELKLLNLSLNSLISMEDIGYNEECPSSLVILDLSANKLSAIRKEEFSNMNSLHVVDLSSNQIRTVAADSFSESASLIRKLILNDNRVSELSDLPKGVEILDLANNFLPIIPPALSQLTLLTQLNLSGNSLDAATPFFLQSSQLEVLDLDRNSFQTLPRLMFQNTTAIKLLRLSGNRITRLEPGVFLPLDGLEGLKIDNNKLSTVTKETFEGVKSLIHLSLANNSISDIQDNLFQELPNLQELVLAHNLLLDLPASLVKLYHLETLDLSDNKIVNVHKFLFDKLPKLRTLILRHNKLGAVERYVFEDLPALQSLDLSYNHIESLIPNCFGRSDTLQEIQLQKNAIKNIEGTFSSMKQLRVLNISENHLTFVDYSMFPTSLETLLMHNNRLMQLTNVVPDRTLSLRHIDVHSNRLKFINSHSIPNSVQAANFSFNRIETVESQTLFTKVGLLRLDLRGNQLGQLNEWSFQMQPAILRRPLELFLGHNPLVCTCQMNWMKKAQRGMGVENMPVVPDYHDLVCQQRHSNKAYSLRKMDAKDLLCAYDIICSEDCVCCEFESCDCKNVCPEGCSCYHDSAFVTNIVKCSDRGEEPVLPTKIPMYASQIYLDGSFLPLINQHAFLGRFRLQHLYVNKSGVKMIEPRAFNGLTSLQLLDLSDNALTEITGEEFHNIPKLRHLFLNGNFLTRVAPHAFDPLPSLQSLTLHHNRLQTLPAALLPLTPSLYGLTLSANPWRCDCGNRFLLQSWLPQHRDLVRDSHDVNCVERLNSPEAINDTTVLSRLPPTEGKYLIKVNFWVFRTDVNQSLCMPIGSRIQIDEPTSPPANVGLDMRLIVGILVASMVLIAIVVMLAVWRNRKRGPNRQRQRKGPPSLNSSGTTSTPVPLIAYDAFITYSLKDEDFVNNELAPRQENEPPFTQLCLLYRDLSTETFSTCHLIHDDIINAMKRSYCIVIVLTQNFLENEWEMVQIRTAHLCLLKEKQQSAIFILMGDLDLEVVDPILGHFLRTSTRLHYSDPMFWERLKEALPQKCSAQDSLNTSAHYSDMYGTIVPSSFV